MELSDQSAFLSEHTALMTADVFQTENICTATLAVLALLAYNRDRGAFYASPEVNSPTRLMSLGQTSSSKVLSSACVAARTDIFKT
jgi:hypothetical protein